MPCLQAATLAPLSPPYSERNEARRRDGRRPMENARMGVHEGGQGFSVSGLGPAFMSALRYKCWAI